MEATEADLALAYPSRFSVMSEFFAPDSMSLELGRFWHSGGLLTDLENGENSWGIRASEGEFASEERSERLQGKLEKKRAQFKNTWI